jgi:hypothetical protein
MGKKILWKLFILVITTLLLVCFLNLASHIFFAGVVTAVVTGNPYFALLAGIGSFIPDLDREYIMISPKTFREEQFHRSLFHNLLFLSALFFVNVYLALGAFLHSFLDSFTTEKDKGVEWLFPFSRLVKRGRYTLAAKSVDGECKLELIDQKPRDRVCFINEDSPEMTQLADQDLKEPKSVPWRRTYGPATNSQMLDKWLALASFSAFAIYAFLNRDFALAGRNLLLSTQIIAPMMLLTGIVLLFLSGWLKKNKQPRKLHLSFFVVGCFFLVLASAMSVGEIMNYILPINPLFAVTAGVVLLVEALFVWWLSTRNGKKALI